MRAGRRGLVLAGLTAVASIAVPLATAVPALAHPLGNSSTNLYNGLRIEPDKILVDHVIDLAELRTVQLKPQADTDGNGTLSPPELSAYAATACSASLPDLTLTVAGRVAPLSVEQSEMVEVPGQGGLQITRIGCTLSAPATISGRTTISYRDTSFTGRFGWREITAVYDGTTKVSADVPSDSVSKRLTAYPAGALSAALDERTASVVVRPGGPRLATANKTLGLPPGVLPRGVDVFSRHFLDLVGRQHLGFGIGLLALLAAVVLGCGHAVAPGHGKTVMAAYLVGQRGTRRQAALLGGVVTATHTIGVLGLGVLLLASSSVASERFVPSLEVVSGLLLGVIGFTLLRTALRRRRAPSRILLVDPRPVPAQVASLPVPAVVGVPLAVPHHEHEDHDHAEHDHPHHDHAEHDHAEHDHPQHDHPQHDHAEHDHPPGMVHDHGFGAHRHVLPDPEKPFSRKSLAAMGVAGGLVPSPSALVVLLGAVGLGRAWYGVLLVIAYGAGMALTLTVAGLALLKARSWLDRPSRLTSSPRLRRLALGFPVLTSTVILLVAAVIVGRGLLIFSQFS